MLCFLMPVCPPLPIISHLAQTKRSSHWFSLFSTLSRVTPVPLSLCDVRSPSKRPAKPLCPGFVFRLPLSLLWKAHAPNVNSSPCKNSQSFDCTFAIEWNQNDFYRKGTVFHPQGHFLLYLPSFQTNKGDKGCTSRCPEHCRNQGHKSVFCSFTYALLNIFSFLLCVLAPSLLFCTGFAFFCTK